jgi:UrcA family protein
MKTQLIAVSALLAAGLAASAFAAPIQTTADEPQLRVSYDDINTATAAGQKALETRIRAAATRVCEQQSDSTMDVAATQRFKACMAKTVAAAMAKVPSSAMIAGSTRPNG